MQVWVVTGECGDYYCGCGIGHLLGVFSTPENAQLQVNPALAVTTTYIRADGSEDTYRDYYSADVEGPFTVDVLSIGSQIVDQRKGNQ